MTNGYETLRAILDEAYAQSSTGKGRERHATNGEPWERQPILEISRRVGLGFPLGQAIKKCTEAAGMVERGQVDAAVRELLGAIVYTAAGVALVRERVGEVRAEPAVEPEDDGFVTMTETRSKPGGVTIKPYGVYERRDGLIVAWESEEKSVLNPSVTMWHKVGGVQYYTNGKCSFGRMDLAREIVVGNGWKPWNGGERPVDGDNTVEYTLRGGYRRYSTASSLSWNHIGCVDDIIAYRVDTDNTMPAPTADRRRCGVRCTMPDPKCVHAHVDGLASMDLPEGHAPEVLCTFTDIGGMVCSGEEGCRFFSAKPDMSALREDVAKAVLDPIQKIVTLCCSNDIDWVERSDGQMVADVAIAAIRAAGYDIVPRK